MKKILILPGVVAIFLLTGCAELTKLTINSYAPEVPKIKKHSIKYYQDINFSQVIRNIYAEPEEKLSTKYLVDCKSVSDINHLKGSNYLCERVRVGEHFITRNFIWQKKVNQNLKILNDNVKNELNKFCIAKNGVIVTNQKVLNGKKIMDICLIDNKPYFGVQIVYSRGNNSIKIYSSNFFKISEMSFSQRLNALKKFLLKNGAKQIKQNLFDVSKYKAHLFYSIKRFFPKIDYTNGFHLIVNINKEEFFTKIAKLYTKEFLSTKEYNDWWNNYRITVYYDNNANNIVAILKQDKNRFNHFYQLLLVNPQKASSIEQRYLKTLHKQKKAAKEQNKEFLTY